MLMVGLSHASGEFTDDGGGTGNGSSFNIGRGKLQFVLRSKLIVTGAIVAETGHLLAHLIIVSRSEDKLLATSIYHWDIEAIEGNFQLSDFGDGRGANTGGVGDTVINQVHTKAGTDAVVI